jgi:pimeloyl-ACP methyl ester carboxylesterase
VIAIAAGLWQLEKLRSGLTVSRVEVGTIPLTLFRGATTGPAPLVVVAHGFSGSQQLMQPFAVTLARNGFIVLTFDFPGHGRNPVPLQGGIADDDARSRELLDALDAVIAYGRGLPGADGRVALLGHSMASDIVVRYAIAQPEIAATVGVSLFAPGVTATSPRNLLVVDGALEPAMLLDEGRRIVAMAVEGAPKEAVTYGGFAEGTARRLALSDGVEHIGVLYSAVSMAEARDWLGAALDRPVSGFIDARGPALGLLFDELLALAYPLRRLLPVVAEPPMSAGLTWRRLLLVAVLPAVLTPLVLHVLPTTFLPLLLGDYLVVHFAVYGLLTAVGLWLVGHRPGATFSWGRLAIAASLVAAYGILVLGLPVNRYLSSFMPTEARVPLILAMLASTLPYFAADEWLTRGTRAPLGGYAATKVCFLLSLALAIALDLERLFFLIIIVPAILLLFLVYGLLSRWACARTGHPLVDGLANALAFAWAIAVTFPLVAGAG